MKPPKQISLATIATAIALVIVGCGHKDGDSHAQDTETGVTFNAKKGLRVPSATAKFIGLKVADVETRKIAATFQFPAQVYRAANEARLASLQPASTPAALASGNVSPVDAAKLSEGQSISAQSAGSGVSLPGRIVTLKRDLETASGQVEVLLAIADAPQSLASGAFISITIPLDGDKRVASVPRAALLRTTEGDFVYTVSGEHFMRATVKLGIVNQEFAEVTDGLYAGDEIVVQPVMTLWMAELQSIRGGKACADCH